MDLIKKLTLCFISCLTFFLASAQRKVNGSYNDQEVTVDILEEDIDNASKLLLVFNPILAGSTAHSFFGFMLNGQYNPLPNVSVNFNGFILRSAAADGIKGKPFLFNLGSSYYFLSGDKDRKISLKLHGDANTRYYLETKCPKRFQLGVNAGLMPVKEFFIHNDPATQSLSEISYSSSNLYTGLSYRSRRYIIYNNSMSEKTVFGETLNRLYADVFYGSGLKAKSNTVGFDLAKQTIISEQIGYRVGWENYNSMNKYLGVYFGLEIGMMPNIAMNNSSSSGGNYFIASIGVQFKTMNVNKDY